MFIYIVFVTFIVYFWVRNILIIFVGLKHKEKELVGEVDECCEKVHNQFDVATMIISQEFELDIAG